MLAPKTHRPLAAKAEKRTAKLGKAIKSERKAGKVVVGTRILKKTAETESELAKLGEALKRSNVSKKAKRVTGETSSTKKGKQVHKQRADERRASGEYDMVNEPFKDKNGNIIEVPKRIDKYGRPSKKSQRAIPDAVQGPPKGIIIDDKPAGRPISKDKQEMRRFNEAYEQKYGEPPKKLSLKGMILKLVPLQERKLIIQISSKSIGGKLWNIRFIMNEI